MITLSKAPVEWVRSFGGYCTDAVLDPSTKIFEKQGLEGIIGYRTEEGINVVYGDPIAPIELQGELAKAFQTYSENSGLSVLYICTSPIFSAWMAEHLGYAKLEFGEEIYFDPQHDPQSNTGDRASLLRRKVRRAQKNGVTVHELDLSDLQLKKDLEAVADAWLNGRSGIQLHISHVHLFDNPEGKRWFWAEQEGKPIGVGVINRLQAHSGWLMNHLMMHPDAPNGTTELLVTSILSALKKEGCSYVTVGSVPRNDLGEIQNLPSLASWLAKMGYRMAGRFLSLDAKKKYWEKFSPEAQGSYLLFQTATLSRKNLKALFKALNIKSTNLFS